MRWEQGRAEIDRMLAAGELERVQPSREHADRLLGQAWRHLDSAEKTCESDPEGAYGVLYDAARKALWAVLANQGIRPIDQAKRQQVAEPQRGEHLTGLGVAERGGQASQGHPVASAGHREPSIRRKQTVLDALCAEPPPFHSGRVRVEVVVTKVSTPRWWLL